MSFKNYSSYRVVYFIKHKSNVIDKFKKFDLIENKFQRNVKTHQDKREYNNERTLSYL